MRFLLASVIVLSLSSALSAQVKVTIERNNNATAMSAFKFKNVPAPSKEDAATNAKVLVLDGEIDPNGAELSALTDGLLPTEEDQPAKNLFFNAGTGGGRIRIDLGRVIEIAQVN